MLHDESCIPKTPRNAHAIKKVRLGILLFKQS
ncbi:hypothetical protein E2C01_067392 [Portunus trituberculatus]|uniref:Uncharacterized protein n=1 Tax=Portunus trituberculatus TaxID=210409 RepID=A0A5B7HXC4_PORTR|nr:hypothetical protein [Portunus trituberculatus]